MSAQSSTTYDVEQQVDIARPMAAVFEGILDEMTEQMRYEDGRSMNMKIERWPGGRWFRDLGDGKGHLWGFVQTHRPPDLLELIGPTMMSYPALNHIEFKLSEVGGGTRLSFRHRAIGMLQDDHVAGMKEGWGGMLKEIKSRLESKS